MKRSEIVGRPMSELALSSLEPEETEYRVNDGNGLYFRVKPSGSKSWQLRHKKPDGKWSWIGIGSYGSRSHQLTGAQAHKKAKELYEVAIADSSEPEGTHFHVRDRAAGSQISSDAYLISQPDAWRMLGMTKSGLEKLRVGNNAFPLPMKSGSTSQSRNYFVRAEIVRWLVGMAESSRGVKVSERDASLGLISASHMRDEMGVSAERIGKIVGSDDFPAPIRFSDSGQAVRYYFRQEVLDWTGRNADQRIQTSLPGGDAGSLSGLPRRVVERINTIISDPSIGSLRSYLVALSDLGMMPEAYAKVLLDYAESR